jgi:signal transduction histidine kinase
VVKLEASKLFEKIGPEEMDRVHKVARERKFGAGQEVFREGDAGDCLYVVKEGMIEISGIVGTNVRQSFSQVGPGEFFGEMAVLEDKPRSASAVALKPTTVYAIGRDHMLKLIEGSPALSLILLREISNRLREFDRQYLREVLQTERLTVIGRFARSIVHDLKNPLNIIGLTAEIAGQERATPEMRKHAQERIRKQVERISDMIGEILDFTQGSHSAFVLAPTNYGLLVEQFVEEIRPEAALKSASLEIEGPLPSIELRINPKRLRRVFYNLLHNATDAMPNGGKIIVRVRATEKEVITEVQDSGAGIAPEIAEHLFEAFVTHGKAHGTGLGLSISKRILQDHEGWISARNEPGHGAVFSFGLPISKESAKRDA